jgi:LacI family transcriptional regulator
MESITTVERSQTIRTIAAACGCSRNTVSLALKHDPQVKAERARSIRKIAQKLGYRPDPRVAQVMSNIAKRNKQHLSKIGVLVAKDFDRPDPWKDLSYLSLFYDGISEQMNDRGYLFDCFWLGAPNMTPSRMKTILLTRGIEGLIVFSYSKAPAIIDFDFSNFAASAIGRALNQPRLDAVGGDLHNDLNTVVLKIQERGFDRIGLALDKGFSVRSLHSWEAAYQYYRANVPEALRIPTCIYSRSDTTELENWMHQFKPDCVIGTSVTTYKDLIDLGFSFPQDAGFVTLSQDDNYPGITGIELPHRLMATKAVDIVAEKLRNHERGLPKNPELVLFAGRWIEGNTLVRR